MKTNKEKFLALVSSEKVDTIERNKERIKNRAMLRESQNIAIKVLRKLDELAWSQKELAREMGVSPQQISKIVSGKENLTIETQIKLQNILDIPILASFYEREIKNVYDSIFTLAKRCAVLEVQVDQISAYKTCKIIKMDYRPFTQEYNFNSL